ncbi:MAG: transcriptional regulator [Clostridiales bacterium]|nr:MAG: transcriptional regulator [Clostridiales bacterium]
MDEKQFRDRVTELRLKKGVSEYQMSYDLGHSKGYVHNIVTGKSMPSLREFFYICEYFEITPAEFFYYGEEYPPYLQQAYDVLKTADEEDVIQLISLFM